MLRNMTRNMTRNVTRRQMLAMPAALAVAAEAAATDSPAAGFRIGVCSYTFREFQRKMAIDMIGGIGRFHNQREGRPPSVLAESGRTAEGCS